MRCNKGWMRKRSSAPSLAVCMQVGVPRTHMPRASPRYLAGRRLERTTRHHPSMCGLLRKCSSSQYKCWHKKLPVGYTHCTRTRMFPLEWNAERLVRLEQTCEVLGEAGTVMATAESALSRGSFQVGDPGWLGIRSPPMDQLPMPGPAV